MARKPPDLNNLFRPTEPSPGQGQPLAEAAPLPARASDRTLPIGVGLKQSEIAQLDAIGAELGLARNALMRWAVAYFLREYRAGRIELTVDREEKRRVRMP